MPSKKPQKPRHSEGHAQHGPGGLPDSRTLRGLLSSSKRVGGRPIKKVRNRIGLAAERPAMSTLRVMAIALLAAWAGGCAGPMSQGISDYHRGSYPEAASHLAEAEPDRAGASERTRTRYALYRGLTHLALGDKESAQRWMSEAKARWDADRGLLDRAEQGRLLAGWEALGHEPGEWGAVELERRGLYAPSH